MADSSTQQRLTESIIGAANDGGVPAVLALIGEADDARERRNLYRIACKRLGRDDWPGRTLDNTIMLYREAIDEGVRQSDAQTNPVEAERLLDFANVMSFNLSAHLADCWPNDDRPREVRHFLAGRMAAEDCLEWRRVLKKGPLPFSLAYWAQGMHLLSLGEADQALNSFLQQLSTASEAAEEQSRSVDVGPDATFGVNLAVGYVGIAGLRSGDPEGGTLLQQAIAAFEDQARVRPDEAGDATFGIAQLKTVSKRYPPG